MRKIYYNKTNMFSVNLQRRIFAWVDRKHKKLQKIYYKDKFMSVVFSDIWRSNVWTGEESVSGPGSSMSQTKEIRGKLPLLLKELHVKSFLDIPCGDFNWMKSVDLSYVDKYIGADIIPEMVETNNKCFSNKQRTFCLLDITKDSLPQVDLILLRDCLVHFSYEDIAKAIKNIKQSKSTYILTTIFSETVMNEDIITGYWRPLNLQKPPFNFTKPLQLLNEKCTEQKGKYKDKSLGLWKIKDIS